jgi:hypothetical protein
MPDEVFPESITEKIEKLNELIMQKVVEQEDEGWILQAVDEADADREQSKLLLMSTMSRTGRNWTRKLKSRLLELWTRLTEAAWRIQWNPSRRVQLVKTSQLELNLLLAVFLRTKMQARPLCALDINRRPV